MFGISEQEIIQWFATGAYNAELVYLAVVVLMFASSFGFPLPEEVSIVSSGLVAYVAHNPEIYPVPEGAGTPVNMWVLAAVCFFAVVVSDVLVFVIGRVLGRKFRGHLRFQKWAKSPTFLKAESWTVRYGAWAAGVFRFTPGLRFPGFMACGAFGVSGWKFLAVDGTAALLTVPTQIILLGYYGHVFLENLKVVKYVVFGLVVAFVIFTLFKKLPFFKATRL